MDGLSHLTQYFAITPSSLLDEVIVPYLPTYLVSIMVIVLTRRRRPEPLECGLFGERADGRWALPLSVWALQTALRTYAATLSNVGCLARVEPPTPPIAVFAYSLFALLLVVTIHTFVLSFEDVRPGRLGLSKGSFLAFHVALATCLLDVFLAQWIAWCWPW